MFVSIRNIFIIVGIGLFGWVVADQLFSSSYEPILARRAVPAEELPRGFVVWGSNRSGNHDIYRMSLPDREVTRLTNHPHAEYFPRISPDGKAIVFSRSRKPRVSQRDHLQWDVILLDLETGKERMLSEWGNTPTWSRDGRRVYFQHKVTQFVEHELASGKQRVVFQSGTGKVREGAGLQTPHLSPGGERLAVTLRSKQHLIGTVDRDGELVRIADGCQLTWSPGGDFLYFVDYGGRMKNAVYVYEPANGKVQTWFDMPGKFSHEYFPKLSDDERYLVFGASRSEKAHEHDQADFENFLWRVGTPIESAVRLTFDKGNDNYPDIFLYDEQ